MIALSGAVAAAIVFMVRLSSTLSFPIPKETLQWLNPLPNWLVLGPSWS